MGIMLNQTAARLILQTNLDFNNFIISSCAIEYIKPDGTTGSWDANILDDDEGSRAVGKIYVNFSNNVKFDQGGYWYLSSKVNFPDGRSATGETVKYFVKTPA